MNVLEALLGTHTSVTCVQCAIVFSVPAEWVAARRSKHDTFYCPNGHQLAFPEGPSEEERLKRKLEATEAELQRARGRAELAERRRRAAKGQLTKIRLRAADGSAEGS